MAGVLLGQLVGVGVVAAFLDCLEGTLRKRDDDG